ncbi:MAG: c-type cytochrome [Opitutaceae bacterium]|nr:c-type cytochrome [Opitutaceae bacterium]
MPSRFRLLSLLPLLLAPLFAQRGDRAGETQAPPPAHIKIPPAPILTAEQALKTFTVAKGFRVELIAGDPLVGDPISMAFGPDGRLWVLEMRGYMQDVDGKGEDQPVGSIAVLTDTDGDGRMDKRTVFAAGLVMPRAMSLVGDGLLVAEPPKLWFMRDTDGDGVADQKTEVAADYGNTTNPEHNSNGLLWALDNWIYSANHTTRFRYEGAGKFTREPTITRGQWGISQDDTGRLYYNSNSDPLRFDAVPSAYLRRNPNFPATGTNIQLVPARLATFPGRVTPGINRGYNTLDKDGKLTAVTAACGPVIYRGALFPAEFRGDAFIAEPSGNLIKRIKLTEQDGAVAGANAYEGTEFLTSTDERFRPVNLFNGPDGALYVVDLYRGILQHKTYVTTFLRKQIEERGLADGIGLGRIWRIVPESAPAAKFDAGLARADTAALVGKLSDPNGWVRDTAQRLLVEKRDAAAAPLLTGLARTARDPLARLHALWTLEGLGAADKPTVLAALNDRDARVCAAAIRLAEKFLKPATDEAVVSRLAALAARSEPAVRLQLAFSLGEAKTPRAEAALRSLLIAAGSQPYLVDAVVSGLARREPDFIEALAREAKEGGRAVAGAVAAAAGATLRGGDAARLGRVLAVAADAGAPSWARAAVLDGVDRSFSRLFDGKVIPINLTAEPTAFAQFAAKGGSPEAERAAKILASMRWPGKPGMAAAEKVVFSPSEQALFDKGKVQYAALCAGCHQPEGQGLAGLAPSLIFSRWVLGDERVLASIILAGKADGNLVMPTLRAALDDEAIAGVMTFIRNSWEHTAGAVTPATVARMRTMTASREQPWTDEDLAELARMIGGPRGARGPGGGRGPGGPRGGRGPGEPSETKKGN